MANSQINSMFKFVSEVIKTDTILVRLDQQSWVKSIAGMYYSVVSYSSTGKKIISLTLGDFGSLSSSVNVRPALIENNIHLLSSTNVFSSGAYQHIIIVYV